LSILRGSVAPASAAALISPAQLSPAQLSRVVWSVANEEGPWLSLVRYDPSRRWYHCLSRDAACEVWLLSWLPGQSTGFHDHGTSAGAFAVARGTLHERVAPAGLPDRRVRLVPAGAVRSFGAAYVHDVSNESAEPAISVHAYSPPLSSMRRYDVVCGILRATREDNAW
jgi:Cysteine dioxygenase type I